MMMPPSIKKSYKQMRFTIIRGEKFPKMDRWGTIDAYLKTKFMGQTLKTKVVKMKDDLVVWNECMLIPIQWPVSSDRLAFELFDHEMVGSDELVATKVFSQKRLVKKA